MRLPTALIRLFVGINRAIFKADLSDLTKSRLGKPGYLRRIRRVLGPHSRLGEDALQQLIRINSLSSTERVALRRRAACPTSGIIGWTRGSREELVADWQDALAAAGSMREKAVAWLHWPIDLHNPYQPLLYSRFASRGLAPMRLYDWSKLDGALASLPSGTPIVLHLHWLYHVTSGSTSLAAAEEKVRRFCKEIDTLRARGIRIVWTVHNLMPHEMRYSHAELELRRHLMRTVDVVHVMAAEHEQLLRDTYDAAAKSVVVAPHPSFVGAYPDWIDRQGARVHLGIPEDLRVLVTLGQIRPYKGYGDFLRLLDHTHGRDPSLRWLIAGAVREEEGWREFISAVASHPAVLCFPRFAAPQDLQYYLRAADAAVFPYLRSLNSGAIALAATFGLPAYVSLGTRLGGLLPEAGHRRFDLADPGSLEQALNDGRTTMENAAVHTAVLKHAEHLRPDRVSGDLADALIKALNI